jgi:hypothetical protein
MLTSHQKDILSDIEQEVLVKGPATVAGEIGISEGAVRELVPKESKEHDEATQDKAYLDIGDKVEMKDGEVLTVKALEFREFVSEERIGYVPKRNIVKVLA